MSLNLVATFDGTVLDPVQIDDALTGLVPAIQSKEAWAKDNQIAYRQYAVAIGQKPTPTPPPAGQ